MVLPGGTLLKVLAVAAAVLTVPTGMPSVRCVCPDGRVKLGCPGMLALGCCCSAPTAPLDGSPHGCCRHGASAPVGRADRSPGLSQAAAACGCERTVTAGALPPVAKVVDGETPVDTTGPAAGVAIAPTSPTTASHVTAAWRLVTPPPDLVLVYCHFTC